MITFARLGQTPFFVELDPDPDANFGLLGFLLPRNAPRIPPTLTLEESWNWRYPSYGAGWYIFAAPDQVFPDPDNQPQLLDRFLNELWKRLPDVAVDQSAGCAWISGNISPPEDMTVVRLPMTRATSGRPPIYPATPRISQTYTFRQFVLVIDEYSEVRMKPDFSGFEIQSSLPEPSVRLTFPVPPYVYQPATNVTVSFEGEGRGGFQFTLEPLQVSQLNYDALDPAIYYYLRPEASNGSTPRALRYPVLDQVNTQGTLELRPTLRPASEESSFVTINKPESGTPTPITTNFRTPSGFPVQLLSGDDGRFYFRPRPNFNQQLSDLDTFYYLAPSGSFEVVPSGPLDSEGMTRILTGYAGTEYVRVKPTNGSGPGDALSFVVDQNAYAETFGALEVGGGALLTPDYMTSWGSVLGANGDNRSYYAQPPDAPLFRANGLYDGTTYLDFSEIPAASVTHPSPTAFPITPVAGVEPIDTRVDVETYKAFENDVLIQVRNSLIKQNGSTLTQDRSLISLEQANTLRSTTPQGLLVDIDTTTFRYTRVLLGKQDNLSLAINNPTEEFQAALSSPKLFLVISNLEKVGDFSENALAISGWKFVADIAANASGQTKSVMILKFFEGTTLDALVKDTSQWTDPDEFTDATAVSAKLQDIIADVRTRAADPNADGEPEIVRYYQNLVSNVIDAPNWAGIIIFDVPLDNAISSVPRPIRGLLPGMVITKEEASSNGTDYTVPTNLVDPAFKAHHLRLDIAYVSHTTTIPLGDIENSSVYALIDYANGNAAITGAAKWIDSTAGTFDVDSIENVSDFSFRVNSMQVTFENSHVKNFLSTITLRFHKLFKEIPSLTPNDDVSSPVDSIDLSGALQQVNGILTYVFRFGCVDPLKKNFIVCAEKGLDASATVLFPDVSPVITKIEATRVDYNMRQIGVNEGDSNIAEFAVAGYMAMRELDGRDVFSYDRVGFGNLTMALNFNTPTPAEMTDDIAMPEQLGNPFWIFTPNTMRFDTLRGEARAGSSVKTYPLAVSGIAESVSTFSAADMAVFPTPNLVPFSKPMYPYKPSGTAGFTPSPVTYIISYSVKVSGFGASAGAGGLIDITIHTGWKEGTWVPSGENVFYTALQWGTPLTNLDIGLQGMFKVELKDFGFGEVPTSTDDRIFFIYVNDFALTILKWSVRASLILFAPAPEDEGFSGAFGEGGTNITAWFGSLSVAKGATGTSGVEPTAPPVVQITTQGTPVIELTRAAIQVHITRNSQDLPQSYHLEVHGHLRNTQDAQDTLVTVSARLYENGFIKSAADTRTQQVIFKNFEYESFSIDFPTASWPNSDQTYAAEVQISGTHVSNTRGKRIRQTNTVTIRADLGKPAPGAPFIQFNYLAAGHGVRLRRGSAAGGGSNLNAHPAPRTVGAALSLMQEMLPTGESGPDLYNVLRDIYAPSGGTMVGVDITILNWLRLAVVANTADEIYGGLLELKNVNNIPKFLKKVAGIRVEIIYRRLRDDSDLGVYEGTLVLPDIIRKLQLGGFSITIPVISLQIYTDGGFLIDLGFPTGSFTTGYDFSRSFSIQGFIGPFPVMGSVGLYFGRLSPQAEPIVPDLEEDYEATWQSVWKFGFAAKLGFGKAYERGPFAFEFSLTAQLVFQGIASALELKNPPPDEPESKLAPADFLLLEASLSLVLYIMGKFEVSKAGFRLSASLTIKASLGVQFRYMTAVDIRITISVTLQAQLKIELDLRLFTISISLSFEFKFQPTFTIKNNEHPEWVDHVIGGYPPPNIDRGDNVLHAVSGSRFLAGMDPAISWTLPGAIWDSSFDSAFIFQDGDGNDVDLRVGGKLPLTGVFAAPYSMDSSGALTSVSSFVIPELHARFLQAGMFVWTAKMVLGASTNGNTQLTVPNLIDIRDAVDDGRQELTYEILNDFLDTNYAFSTLSAEDDASADLLKPDGAVETAAAVFPMFPDFSISYTSNGGETEVRFDEQTQRDDTYYQNLDAYLEALVMRLEEQMGSGLAGANLAGTIPTKALATHVFEAYFELYVETGIEQAVEAKVPRGEPAGPDPAETWSLAQIVKDIIDRENPTIIRPLSGLVSRLMLGGHQLPDQFDMTSDPPLPTGFESIYALTGQQVPVELPEDKPDLDEDEVIWTLTLKDGDNDLASATITVAEYDALTALPANLASAIGFGPSGDQPRIEPVKPFLEQSPAYPFEERVPFDSSASGTLDRALLPFSSPLLTRLSGWDPADGPIPAQPMRATFSDKFGRDATDISPVASDQFEWVLIIPFTADKVVDTLASANGAGKVYLKDTYKLGGTDELTRGRIADLMADLISGNPAIIGVDVLRQTQVGEVAGLAPLGVAARILKTNLSTISAPRADRGLAQVAPPDEKFYGDLTTDDIFASLRLLWEASIVNAPGFYLEVDGDGLPDDAFPEGTESADLTMVIRIGGSGVPSYANGIRLGWMPEKTEGFHLELSDPNTKVAIPVGVPGTIAFYIGRDAPDPQASDIVRRTAGLFNLVAYRIKDAGSHAGSWGVSDESWSLPFGPLKLDESQLPDAILTSDWKYEVAVPWTKFLTGGRTNSPIFSSTGSRSPYDLVGGTMELEFVALDTWGNQYPQKVDHTFDIKYFDPLISIAQWPEVTSFYHFTAEGGGDGHAVLILEFNTEDLIPTSSEQEELDAIVNRARGLRSQYETIWFQLSDPNTNVRLRTSLKQGDGELALAGGASVKDELRAWVEEILGYLDAKVNGTTAGEPQMKVLTTVGIDRATRDLQSENIHRLRFMVEMSRPDSMVDAAAEARLESVGSVLSDIKADTMLVPTLPDLPDDIPDLPSDSMVAFAQKFEQAFPELRLAAGDSEGGDQTLWAIRIGRGLGPTGPGIRVSVNQAQRSHFASAPLSTQLETCTITDPQNTSETLTFSLIDMDELGRRFVSVVDDMLSQERVVGLRRENPDQYRQLLNAKRKLAEDIPNGMLSIFTEQDDAVRQDAARELYRQELLKTLSAAYKVDTIVSYDMNVSNSETVTGPPPNLYGHIISLEPSDAPEPPFVVGRAKLRLGNDADGNPPKLSFTFSTDNDSERAQLPAHLGFQVTYIEHNIETDKPAWAPPSDSYEYRGSTWLKLILPDNPRVLNEPLMPNEPMRLTPDGPINVPIPLREFPPAPAALRQFGTPEVAEGEQVTLAQAAAWEYEYQIERPRAAQDRIYLHIAFNEKQAPAALAGAEDTLLHALCTFDLMYSRLIGADKPIEEQTRPTPEQLLTLLPQIQQVADTWGSWVPNVPKHEYTWVEDDWAYHISETVAPLAGDVSEINIKLKPLEVKQPKAGKLFGNYPEIRVPNSDGDEPLELVPVLSGMSPGSEANYRFNWTGVVPDNQTRSFVFSNLNVLQTENARGRIWLTRNENLGELDGLTTNERFIYRSGATEFSDAVQPYIDRTVPVDIVASVPSPGQQTLDAYLEKLFEEIFGIAIDNDYDWPLTKLGCRFGYDPRGVLAPPTGPEPEDQFIVYLPVLEHVPFTPTGASDLANEIVSVIDDWEAHWDIPGSPTNGTGFYEFDLSVFSTLIPSAKGAPVLRLRRMWIRRF